jgi:hypothetical protein
MTMYMRPRARKPARARNPSAGLFAACLPPDRARPAALDPTARVVLRRAARHLVLVTMTVGFPGNAPACG